MKPTKYVIFTLNGEKQLMLFTPTIQHIQAVGTLKGTAECVILSAGWVVKKGDKVVTYGNSPTLSLSPAEGDAEFILQHLTQ